MVTLKMWKHFVDAQFRGPVWSCIKVNEAPVYFRRDNGLQPIFALGPLPHYPLPLAACMNGLGYIAKPRAAMSLHMASCILGGYALYLSLSTHLRFCQILHH